MKKILPLLFFAAALPACAQKITASITITNATTTGMTFTLNGDTRTFTNNVVNPAAQVLTNSDATGCGSKTNLIEQIYATPFSQVTTVDKGSNSFNLVGNSGLPMAVSVSAGYASISYSTQQVFSLTALAIPIASLPTAQARTNEASALVAGINQPENTNQIDQTSIAATQLMGLTKNQTIAGANAFLNPNSLYVGGVSNSPSISGNLVWLNGGVITNAHLIWRAGGITNAEILNGAALFKGGVGLPNNAGDAIWTIGDTGGSGGFQMGVNLVGSSGHFNILDLQTNSFIILPPVTVYTLSTVTNLGVGTDLSVGGNASVGTNLIVTGSISNGGNLAIAGNMNLAGTETNFSVTGSITATGADIAFARKSVTGLAAGNNAAVTVGTNCFVEVSGPTGAFAINGLANGRDGKLLILCNQTAQTMTLANQSGVDPTPANRILTGSGADLAITNNPGMVLVIYSGAASRWLVVSHN